MTTQKRNVVRRLRRLVVPLLYPTGIADRSQPDGHMRLYLFQHRGTGLEDEPNVRPIAGRYDASAGVNAGDPIDSFYGFAADAIVDDVCVGITLYPFWRLPLPTLRSLERLARSIRGKEGHRKSPKSPKMNEPRTLRQFVNDHGLSLDVSPAVEPAPPEWGAGARRYTVVLSMADRSMRLHFRHGVAVGGPPTADGVLEMLAADAAGVENNRTFAAWAQEYGHDREMHAAVKEQTRRLKAFLGPTPYRDLLRNRA